MDKPNYLGLPTLEISKTVMYGFWFDYINSKYQEKTNLCYMHTYSLQ